MFKQKISDLHKEFMEKSNITVKNDNGLVSNFVHVNDELKVMALDSIIDISKDVYGPYGGLYVHYTKSVQTGEKNTTKSKDGNQFFERVELVDPYADAILNLIKQKTDYIASYEDKTSRDGTTSLSMVSSCMAKSLLMNRKLGKFTVPSTITNILFDILKEEGSKIIDKYKSLTYDDSTNRFFKDGKETVANAINTTVNNNPIFKPTFLKLMSDCEESNANMLDMFIEAPMYVVGEPNLEFDVVRGVSLTATDVNKLNSKSYKANNQLVFIFDGYGEVDNFVSSLYTRLLYNFINRVIWEIADDTVEGVLLIFNRIPEYIVNNLKEYNEAGVIKCATSPFTPKDKHGRVLKFRAMAYNDTNEARERFEDLLEIFKESVVDVSGMNDYIKEYLAKEYLADGAPKGIINPVVNRDAIADKIRNDYMITGALVKAIDLPESYDPFRKFLGYVDKETGAFMKYNKFTGEDEHISLSKIKSTINFNGYDVNILISDKELLNRVDETRKRLEDIKNGIRSANAETNELNYRIRCLNSSRIQPIIYSRSTDEQTEMRTLTEDAIGVFISTLANGVIGGGNTFFFKHMKELKENCFENFDNAFKAIEISEEKRVKYKEDLSVLVDSVFNGYLMAYLFILENETDEKIEEIISEYAMYEEDHNKTRTTYNVITGRMSEKILEAARTTLDVFQCALSISKDMITISRFNLNSYEALSRFDMLLKMPKMNKINDKFVIK